MLKINQEGKRVKITSEDIASFNSRNNSEKEERMDLYKLAGKMADLFENKVEWIQGRHCDNSTNQLNVGNDKLQNDPNIREQINCCCIMGAIIVIVPGDTWQLRNKFGNLFKDVVGVNPIQWNDDIATSKKEVIAVLRKVQNSRPSEVVTSE